MFCCMVTLFNNSLLPGGTFHQPKTGTACFVAVRLRFEGTTLIFGQASCSSLIHDMSVWISDLFSSFLFFPPFFFFLLLILPSWVTECMKNQLSIISLCQPLSLSLVSSNHRKPNEEDVVDQVLLTVRIIFCALVYSP